MNMLVLLMLYPIVFLFGFFVQTPYMTGRGLPFAIALFIGNIVSVVLLSYLVPWMAERFSWWLQPAGAHPRRIEVAGVALVVALYGVMLLVFWRLFYPSVARAGIATCSSTSHHSPRAFEFVHDTEHGDTGRICKPPRR
jgi:uncharacterized membrane protein